MINKSFISIFAGVFYWLLKYAIVNIFLAFHYEYSDYVGLFVYYIIPFLIGGLLIINIKELRYVGIAYCVIPIVVSYIILFIESVLQLPEGLNPATQTLWLFKLSGLQQILISMLGGLLALIINRRRLKSLTSGRSI